MHYKRVILISFSSAFLEIIKRCILRCILLCILDFTFLKYNREDIIIRINTLVHDNVFKLYASIKMKRYKIKKSF